MDIALQENVSCMLLDGNKQMMVLYIHAAQAATEPGCLAKGILPTTHVLLLQETMCLAVSQLQLPSTHVSVLHGTALQSHSCE
jgi:hypothetical protein